MVFSHEIHFHANSSTTPAVSVSRIYWTLCAPPASAPPLGLPHQFRELDAKPRADARTHIKRGNRPPRLDEADRSPRNARPLRQLIHGKSPRLPLLADHIRNRAADRRDRVEWDGGCWGGRHKTALLRRCCFHGGGSGRGFHVHGHRRGFEFALPDGWPNVCAPVLPEVQPVTYGVASRLHLDVVAHR